MIEDYYHLPEVSNSDLTKLLNYMTDKKELINSEIAYKFGRLIDALITEQHTVDHFNFCIGDDVYNKEDFYIAKRMRDAFFHDEYCRNMLKLSEPQKVMREERVFVYEGNIFKLRVRCKWDMWLPAVGWGADIKSTTATTQREFEAACSHFDYDRQRAWYMNIGNSDKDMLIGISKKNYKIFKVPIVRGDDRHRSGTNKYLSLAYNYYSLQHSAA